MDTSDYLLFRELDSVVGTYVCETFDETLVLALERSKERHFFYKENGYPLGETELALLTEHDITEVHVHVEDTDEILRFDASDYLNAEPIEVWSDELSSTVSIEKAQ